MPDEPLPLPIRYPAGSQTQSPLESGRNQAAPTQSGTVSQTGPAVTSGLPDVNVLLKESKIYGTGKARRIVIKGRVSR
jgi:hypothetical protein